MSNDQADVRAPSAPLVWMIAKTFEGEFTKVLVSRAKTSFPYDFFAFKIVSATSGTNIRVGKARSSETRTDDEDELTEEISTLVYQAIRWINKRGEAAYVDARSKGQGDAKTTEKIRALDAGDKP